MFSFIEGLFYSFLVGGGIGIIIGLYYVYIYYRYHDNFLNKIEEKKQNSKKRKYTFFWYLSNYYNIYMSKFFENKKELKRINKISFYFKNKILQNFLLKKILQYLKNVFID